LATTCLITPIPQTLDPKPLIVFATSSLSHVAPSLSHTLVLQLEIVLSFFFFFFVFPEKQG